MDNLFKSATLQLTGWYLLIMMIICVSFSVVIYRVSSSEFERRLSPTVITTNRFDINDILEQARAARAAESRTALIQNLVFVNLVALGLGGVASYLLARRTLQPIEEAAEAQGRFVSDASHELRTPLTAMHTEIEVALRDMKLSKDELRKLLESNLEEVDKLEGLAERLLQLTNGKDIPLSEVSIDEAAIEATNRVLKHAQAKTITIENTVAPIKLQGNLDSLTDVCVILLDNAIKYSEPHTTVKISSLSQGKYAVLSVKDSGKGIKARDLPYIFDRFYRADTSRTKNHVAGYGLGLSIAKKLVDLHGGTIEVTSKPSKGTTFKIRIPLS